MDERMKDIKERLSVEYHIGSIGLPNNTPILDFRQALQDINYLLSRIKELEKPK